MTLVLDWIIRLFQELDTTLTQLLPQKLKRNPATCIPSFPKRWFYLLLKLEIRQDYALELFRGSSILSGP